LHIENKKEVSMRIWMLIVVLALMALFVYTRERREEVTPGVEYEYETLRWGNATTVRVRQPDASEFMPGMRLTSIQRPNIDSIETQVRTGDAGRTLYMTHRPHPTGTGERSTLIVIQSDGDVAKASAQARSMAAAGLNVHTLATVGKVGEKGIDAIAAELVVLLRKLRDEEGSTLPVAMCDAECMRLSLPLAGWRELRGGQSELGARRMYDRLVLRGVEAGHMPWLASCRPVRGSAALLILADMSKAGVLDVQDIREMLYSRTSSWPLGSRVVLWTSPQPEEEVLRREVEQRLIESFLLFNDATSQLGGAAEAREKVLKLGGEMF
jgi:hypothetical protein